MKGRKSPLSTSGGKSVFEQTVVGRRFAGGDAQCYANRREAGYISFRTRMLCLLDEQLIGGNQRSTKGGGPQVAATVCGGKAVLNLLIEIATV